MLKLLIGTSLAAKGMERGGACQPYEGSSEAIQPPERRVALVIGNGDYDDPTATLTDPARDAELMAETLWQLGFDITLCRDADKSAMEQAVRDFGSKLTPDGVALLYYSGHGVQHDGQNWLVPVDATLERSSDVDLETIAVDSVLRRMEGSGSTSNVLLLDACRNNPFGSRTKSAGSSGLAQIAGPPAGTILGFATAPGDVAYEGEGDYSVWTESLATELLAIPGRDLEGVLQATRATVYGQTDNQQLPWTNTSMLGDLTLLPSDGTATVSPAVVSAPVVRTTPQAAGPSWRVLAGVQDDLHSSPTLDLLRLGTQMGLTERVSVGATLRLNPSPDRTSSTHASIASIGNEGADFVVPYSIDVAALGLGGQVGLVPIRPSGWSVVPRLGAGVDVRYLQTVSYPQPQAESAIRMVHPGLYGTLAGELWWEGRFGLRLGWGAHLMLDGAVQYDPESHRDGREWVNTRAASFDLMAGF